MWFWLVLLSAVIGAVEIIINKKALHNVSPLLLTWALTAISLPFFIIWTISAKEFVLTPGLVMTAFGAAFLFTIGKTLNNSSLKEGLVSKLFPLSAFSGIFTYIFGLVFLREHIAFLPLVGMLIVIIGSYVLNAESAKEDLLKPIKVLLHEKQSAIYLLSLVFMSLTGVFDKLTIQQSSPAMTGVIENTLMLLLITPYLHYKEKNWYTSFRSHYKILLLNGVFFTIVSSLVLFSLQEGPLALVVTVRRVQIFFVLVLSIFLLKEKVHPYVWLASILMALGVVFIKIAG